jgi:hypothetical protein
MIEVKHFKPSASSRDRHCERSEAIHCHARKEAGLLRRFAPRNDVALIFTYDSAFPQRDAPEFCMNPSAQKQRAQGMPGARCTRSLACEIKQSTRA